MLLLSDAIDIKDIVVSRLPTTKTRSAALDRNLDVLWDEIVAEMKEKGRNRPCESFWIACGVKEGQDFMRSRVD